MDLWASSQSWDLILQAKGGYVIRCDHYSQELKKKVKRPPPSRMSGETKARQITPDHRASKGESPHLNWGWTAC